MEVSGKRPIGNVDLGTGIFCDLCQCEDEEEIAVFYCTVCNEFFCNTCSKVHRRSKLSKHHPLLDQDSMPKQKFSASKESMCSKHEGKFVEYFCKIHDDCCCAVCATIEHKLCTLEYIDDIVAEYETSKEYTSLMSAIADLTQLLQNTKTFALKKKDDVGHIHMQFVSEVKKFRSEINHILDSLEQSTLIEAQTVRDKDTKSIESAYTSCDAMISDLAEMSSNMEKQKKYKQQRQFVISAKKAQNKINQFESLTTELDSQCKIRDYTFRPNETIIMSRSSLGILENELEKEDKTKIERKLMKSALSKPVSLRYVGRINIEHSTDESEYACTITGGVMLNNNMLALADRDNSSVKIVDVKTNTMLSCIKLPTTPYDITRVEQGQIVVTCDDRLVFIKVGEKVSVMKEVGIGGKSRGIVYTNNTFICSFEDPGCVKIIELGGKILKTISTDIRRQTLFELPFYIVLSTDQTTLYVSDTANHSVTSMDLDGNVQHVYKYNKLVEPHGVAVDREDNIYIAEWRSDSIHIISPQFTTIRVLQDGTPGEIDPAVVIYCERDKRLYISHGGSRSETISVYQIE